VNTLLWSKLGQTLAKTLVKPFVTPCPSGTFAASSKFHLNTSNSTNIKVVQFFEGHNFHVGWHFKFLVEKGGKLGQLLAAPMHRDLAAFNVWEQIMQKPLRKTP
jgi:hypothetical protein